MHIDHVTLRTRDLERTRTFFVEVFGLVERPRPKAIQRIPGYWLYEGDEPIVHLVGSFGHADAFVSEAWDHVGFRLSGHAAFRRKLETLAIPHTPMDLPDLGERRIFLQAPQGQLIEAVFRNETETDGEGQ